MKIWGFLCLLLCTNQLWAKQSFCSGMDYSPVESAKDYKFCVDYVSENIDHSAVIYYFHGIFGSEKTWFESEKYQIVKKHFLATGKPIPPVVTLSFGKTWLVSRYQQGNELSGLYEQIVGEIFPFIESKILNVQNPRRLGFGMSMGGFNLTQIHLHSPFLFTKMALTCPAMSAESPHSGFSGIRDYISRNNARLTYVWKALRLSKKYFPTVADWEFDSPLKYLEKFLISFSGTKFYVSAVTNDEFGFTEGDIILANRLAKQGFSVKWEFIKGGHCDINPESVAKFLMTP